ncbi:MAG: hypothetical protein KME26_19130 [Oscillatoria princeps RMCB-10]|nr:hypothetical protein [Oscillatoria princeps RMCB-10]
MLRPYIIGMLTPVMAQEALCRHAMQQSVRRVKIRQTIPQESYYIESAQPNIN